MAMLASTPADYERRLDAARATVDALLHDADELDRETVTAAVAAVKRNIPDSEKVDWQGGSVEVDNRWLALRLQNVSDEPDDVNRRAILAQISERLTAISESVKQLNDAAARKTTKDENKQKLAEILRREEYQKPAEKEKSLIQKWIDDLIDWLIRAFPRPEISPSTSSGLGSLQFGLQILIYALVIGLMAFLIYKIAPLIMRSFGAKKEAKARARVILGERIEAHESSSRLFSEAERLAREGDLRSAIRKGYIALLCELSDRKLIRLAHNKTNRDYLRDIRTDQALFDDVDNLTRNFERTWYGLRAAGQEDWNEFRGRYMETVARSKS